MTTGLYLRDADLPLTYTFGYSDDSTDGNTRLALEFCVLVRHIPSWMRLLRLDILEAGLPVLTTPAITGVVVTGNKLS